MKSSKLEILQRRLQLIQEIISSEIYNLGDEFFQKLVLRLNQLLKADYTFVGKLLEDEENVKVISVVGNTGILENFTYNLNGTPCENVFENKPCSFPKHVSRLFPKDKMLLDMGIEAYVGVTLYNSRKQPIGILVSLFKSEIEHIDAIELILLVFASKASAELEHIKLNNALEESKSNLEEKIKKRTKQLDEKNKALEISNKKLENALHSLKNTQNQLIHAEKMATLGILTSGVAHEINNPLNYITGAYVGLLDFFDNNSKINKEEIDDLIFPIKIGVDRISSIVKGLNQFSRNNESYDESCYLHEILNNCLAILNNVTKHKINIETNYSPKKMVTPGNSGKLHQVFLNVLANAVDAIDKKGNLTITTLKEGNSLSVIINDDGVGIKKEIINKILDPFFTTKPPGKGTGLGLSISSSIIEDHGGKLKVDSQLGQGTTVTITLPNK